MLSFQRNFHVIYFHFGDLRRVDQDFIPICGLIIVVDDRRTRVLVALASGSAPLWVFIEHIAARIIYRQGTGEAISILCAVLLMMTEHAAARNAHTARP